MYGPVKFTILFLLNFSSFRRKSPKERVGCNRPANILCINYRKTVIDYVYTFDIAYFFSFAFDNIVFALKLLSKSELLFLAACIEFLVDLVNVDLISVVTDQHSLAVPAVGHVQFVLPQQCSQRTRTDSAHVDSPRVTMRCKLVKVRFKIVVSFLQAFYGVYQSH